MVILQLTGEQLTGIIENAVRTALTGQVQQPAPDTDEMLTVDQAAGFLSLGTATIYSMVSRKEIPYMKPNGKRLYFSKQELTDWLKSGRKKTNAEIATDAGNYLRKGPKPKRAR
ncbi:helix-turn-helix domain-containing protein [Adhaeribacter sp. BT258]|uniref:Helix-turn-helix domain-containing protein n=1 Tax=Adhaeribacter terrigena TaxID=2793070 RepID=A0ABS1C3C0_9BACT|nr:helix-turn-helix domain-containing protein [Adhaeribacter terrigena]MBK0403879.1 helix-turn-helix domain-containing protein [Adhaeribacter terrigena]